MINKYFQQTSQTTSQPTILNQYFKNTNYQQQLNLNNIGKNVNSISDTNNRLDLKAFSLIAGQITPTNPTFN